MSRHSLRSIATLANPWRRSGNGILLCLAVAACGSDDGGTGPGQTTDGMVARIDGQNFNTASGGFATATAQTVNSRLYAYTISGTHVTGGTSTIVITIGNVGAPGTIPVGVDLATVFGATA